MGRAAWKPTEEEIDLAGQWAEKGLTNRNIAGGLGIGKTTFYTALKKYPNLTNLIKKRRVETVSQVAQNLIDKALSNSRDSVTAAIFFLKAHGWDDGSRLSEQERQEIAETAERQVVKSVRAKLKFEADKYISSQLNGIFTTLRRELDEKTYSTVCEALSQSCSEEAS